MVVYRLWVTHVSSAYVGARHQELNKEEGVRMIEEALKVTDSPEKVRDILRERLGWEQEGEGPLRRRPVYVHVYNKSPLDKKNPHSREGLIIHLAKVSHRGSLEMEVEAERVEARQSLVGLAAKTVALQLSRRGEVELLELPRNLKAEVARMV